MRLVNLPHIDELTIDGYVLYPGPESDPGLHHNFLSGVNVVVGINGIGKTTLLLMLFRMLAGAKDLRIADELGGSQRSLASVDNADRKSVV